MTACSPSGSALAAVYRGWGWGARVFVWHEAADTRAVPPAGHRGRARGLGVDRQLGRRRARARSWSASCSRRRRRPACALDIYGVRYPERRWRCWRATARATAAGSPTAGARGVRAPPADRARAAPLLRRRAAGHPDHPRVRGAGLRHPAGQRAVGGREHLFTPGEDFLVAATAPRWQRTCARSRAIRRCGRRWRRGAGDDPCAPHLRAPGGRAAGHRGRPAPPAAGAA